jgi:methylenetetrahydrofolate dehydrogenase (NADP+)/methenyltetrahydrofolate cyclohydrolase
MQNNPAKIIDGKEIARQIRDLLIPRINALKKLGIVPGLAVVLVGDDSSSKIYVGMKAKAFAAMQLMSETFHLPADSSAKDVHRLILKLNQNPAFHGILVQIPLPKHLDSMQILQWIDPTKDADGLHPMSMGKMLLEIETALPCTPHGTLMLLKFSDISVAGRHVVVVGRSNIVGKPIANLLAQKRAWGNATVTICHSRTADLPRICSQADILIAAIGKPELITADYVKPGAVVIDVGVNRVEAPGTPKGYRLVGDVKFDEVAQIASAITPVPGGVGPMTIAMLLSNTVYLAEQSTKR